MTSIDGMLEFEYTKYIETGDATRDLMFHGEMLTWISHIQSPYGYHHANVYSDDWEIVYRPGTNQSARFFFRASTQELIDLFKAKLERKI